MNLSEIINLGDKIDIRLTHQVLQALNGEIAEATIYKSVVMDFPSDHQIEVGMPTLMGKMILFQLGIRCNMCFFTKKGMYTCECTVAKRYKKDNFYLLLMDVNSTLTKFQRREFFRVDCSVDFEFYHISEDVAAMRTTEELFLEIQKPEYESSSLPATLIDISGGGMKFKSMVQLEKGDYILTKIRLTNEIIDATFFLASEIIDCEKKNEDFVTRAKFFFKDIKDRETIVRFVFEEERKLRRIKNAGV